MTIDSHQHFWKFTPERDVWITPDMQAIRKDFYPAELALLLQQNGIDGCVAVQADQSEEETSFLLGLADEYDFIRGVVGWVDLKSDDLPTRLSRFGGAHKLKGFRYITQGQPKGFMLDSKLIRGISQLAAHSYTYDILIYEDQLPEAISMVKLLPEMPLVVDHIAKPGIKAASISDWKKGMKQFAAFPYVYVKLSGLITEADWAGWTRQDLQPYLETTLELFGPDRLMFGSDWPVCLLAGSYAQVVGTVRSFISLLSASEQEKIMGKNAVKFYHL